MFLSKSFGYALRGILYIALFKDEPRKVQIDEIAEKLSVPRYFLGKILQQVAKAGLLHSVKGPYGGFNINDNTLSTPLIRLVEICDGMEQFSRCELQFRECNEKNPCPLHQEAKEIRNRFLEVMNNTTIESLLSEDKKNIIKSLAAR
jgi:Rrf2 family transcriptional regulator, iron-sulfur cluster assembly transcription factor